jgi:hypothetical protein
MVCRANMVKVDSGVSVEFIFIALVTYFPKRTYRTEQRVSAFDKGSIQESTLETQIEL